MKIVDNNKHESTKDVLFKIEVINDQPRLDYRGNLMDLATLLSTAMEADDLTHDIIILAQAFKNLKQ